MSYADVRLTDCGWELHVMGIRDADEAQKVLDVMGQAVSARTTSDAVEQVGRKALPDYAPDAAVWAIPPPDLPVMVGNTPIGLSPAGRAFVLNVHLEGHQYVRIHATYFGEGRVDRGDATEVAFQILQQTVRGLAMGKQAGAVGAHVGDPRTGRRYDGRWRIIDHDVDNQTDEG